MFLKKHVRKKNGKAHTYWDLVESYRTPKGPRHRTVAYLGELDVVDCGGWAKLARQLDDKPLPVIRPTLFDPQPDPPSEALRRTGDDPVPEEVTVNVNGVRVEETTDFGDVWLGLTLWRTLGLDKLFARILPEGREEVGWDLMAAILVLGRFCEPSSELHIEDTWYPRTVLPEILGVKARQVHVRRLYQALDVLCGCKDAVEKHLKNRTMKSELCLRPVYHQLQLRVRAHILVDFLAYAMWKTLQKWMENSGLGRGVRTVQEELAKIKCCRVILPTSSGREIQLRCISRPDEAQRILLSRLGLRIPSRLGNPKWRKMIKTRKGIEKIKGGSYNTVGRGIGSDVFLWSDGGGHPILIDREPQRFARIDVSASARAKGVQKCAHCADICIYCAVILGLL